MSEPQRLREAPETDLERSLLDAGRRYRASPGARARTLAALGVTAATAATAATSTAAAGASKWALGLLGLGGLVVPAALYLRPASPPVARAPVHSSVPVLARPALEPAPVPEPLPAPEATGPSAAPARAEPRHAASVPLSAELIALDTARSALGRGDAAGALLSLDGYAKAFPNGKLRLEAEVLRITALARTGRTATANERAQAFLRRHPGSLLAARVRAHLTSP